MNKEIKVLDCTFRDGGYYNNWNFSKETIKKYISSMNKSGVDVVEIGFRTFKQEGFLGALAYSTDDYINLFGTKNNFKICVMSDAADILGQKEKASLVVKKTYGEKKSSPVDIVRIASHFKEIQACKEIVSELKNLGYFVGFNLMQIASKSIEEINLATKEIASWGSVDVLYFADSFGNMTPQKTKEIIATIKNNWTKEIGIHTHDNMGYAIPNTLTAYDEGVTWLDSTVLGMGRGSGNAKTECLLVELNQKGYKKYHPEEVFTLALDDFQKLKDKYKWGNHLFYYLSAVYNIHPTFIQEILSSDDKTPEEMVKAVKTLTDSPSVSFSKDKLEKAFHTNAKEETIAKGTWSPKGLASNRPVLILANGESLKEHSDGVNNFIKRYNPYVLSLNFNKFIPAENISAYVCSVGTRISLLWDTFNKLKKDVIIPKDLIPTNINPQTASFNILNFGLKVELGTFKSEEKEGTIPVNLNLPYALSIAKTAGATKIFMAGFDGYANEDSRNSEVQSVLNLFSINYEDIKLVAITPTHYQMIQKSVYNPLI